MYTPLNVKHLKQAYLGGGVCKAAATGAAGVGFLPGVGAQVHGQHLQLVEGAGAAGRRAAVRAQVVGDHVRLQTDNVNFILFMFILESVITIHV